MTALMADDFTWQLNVPLSPIIRGHVTAIFEIHDGTITCWREYWDTGDIARRLGTDPSQMCGQIGS